MADLPPVQIHLVANGLDGVLGAFKSIEDRARHMEQAMTNLQKQGEQVRTSTAKAGSNARVSAKDKEYAALVRQTEKWGREEVQAEKRKNQQLEADAKRSANARAGFFSRVGAKTVASMQSVASTALRLAGAIAAVGGGFTIADSLSAAVKNQGLAKEISIQSEGGATKEDIYGLGKSLTIGHAIPTDEALAGIAEFGQKSGVYEAEKMKEIMPQLATLANATGASFKDLASSAGLIYGMDTSQSMDQLLEKLRTIAAQGRKGAVDLQDVAGSINAIGASAGQFSGDKLRNFAAMGALGQLARQKGTARSPAEAMESVISLPLDIAEEKHQKQFNALGIRTKNDEGELLPIEEVIRNSVVATKGDKTKLEKLMGRRSYRAVEGLGNEYLTTYAEAKRGGATDPKAQQAGLDAMMKLWNAQMDVKLTKDQAEKEEKERMLETDKQLTVVLGKLKIAVGDALIPKLTELLPVIEKMIPNFVKLLESLVQIADWALKNPLEASFILMGAAMVKGMAQVFAAEAIMAAIGAAGPAGIIAAATAIAGAALAIYIKEGNEKMRKEQEDAGKQDAEHDSEEIRTIKQNIKDLQADKDAGGKLWAGGPGGDTDLLQLSKDQLVEKTEAMKKKALDRGDRASHIKTLQERLDKFGMPTGLEFLGIHNEHEGPFGSLSPKEMDELNDHYRNDPKSEEADKAYVKEINKQNQDIATKQLIQLQKINEQLMNPDVSVPQFSRPPAPATDGKN